MYKYLYIPENGTGWTVCKRSVDPKIRVGRESHAVSTESRVTQYVDSYTLAARFT
jgi:hypothetical protein